MPTSFLGCGQEEQTLGMRLDFCQTAYTVIYCLLKAMKERVMILTPCVTCEFEIDHHSGDYVPYPLRQVCGFLASHKIYCLCQGCETGLTVYCPYRRRPESLTVLHMSFERQRFRAQLFKDPECWSGRDLNQRPPAQ